MGEQQWRILLCDFESDFCVVYLLWIGPYKTHRHVITHTFQWFSELEIKTTNMCSCNNKTIRSNNNQTCAFYKINIRFTSCHLDTADPLLFFIKHCFWNMTLFMSCHLHTADPLLFFLNNCFSNMMLFMSLLFQISWKGLKNTKYKIYWLGHRV